MKKIITILILTIVAYAAGWFVGRTGGEWWNVLIFAVGTTVGTGVGVWQEKRRIRKEEQSDIWAEPSNDDAYRWSPDER